MIKYWQACLAAAASTVREAAVIASDSRASERAKRSHFFNLRSLRFSDARRSARSHRFRPFCGLHFAVGFPAMLAGCSSGINEEYFMNMYICLHSLYAYRAVSCFGRLGKNVEQIRKRQKRSDANSISCFHSRYCKARPRPPTAKSADSERRAARIDQ